LTWLFEIFYFEINPPSCGNLEFSKLIQLQKKVYALMVNIDEQNELLKATLAYQIKAPVLIL
jgi:hypothetical protein